MTLIDSFLFRSVELREFFNQAWNNKQERDVLAKNLTATIAEFNRMGNWVVSTILTTTDLNTRTQVLSRFITIADECFKLNNFCGCFEIIGSLGNSAVHRLSKTWEGLRKQDFSTKEKLQTLMSGNFTPMKKKLLAVEPPVVPYVGPYLTELTFLDEQPDFVDHQKKMINVNKLKIMGGILRRIHEYQRVGYKIQPVPIIQKFFLQFSPLDDKMAIEQSRKLEPKIV